MSEQQGVTIEQLPELVHATVLTRRLEEASTGKMQEEVTAAARSKPNVPVVLDMANVEFLPSVAIGALVSLMRLFKGEGRRFILVGLQPMVRNVLTLTRLDKLFEIHPQFEDALGLLRSSPS